MVVGDKTVYPTAVKDVRTSVIKSMAAAPVNQDGLEVVVNHVSNLHALNFKYSFKFKEANVFHVVLSYCLLLYFSCNQLFILPMSVINNPTGFIH